ncbi:MAG: Asp-tRNA(Asn)/Glu-tRNA(Gln) amidotransferase subunit GatC [Dehalococcoidia bacterium]|nr:Asp-tRNA(Asn)/Glu-tRNA(Gln) amidotransferase subunit GatC [Dehalococcoidia bacterium]
MKLSREEVEHIALLARLGLKDEEIEKVGEQLSNILENMEALKEVDTSQVPPTSQSIALQNVFRGDVVCPSLDVADVISNAIQWEEGSLKVLPVLE